MSRLRPMPNRARAFMAASIALFALGCSDSGRITTIEHWTESNDRVRAPVDVRLPMHFTREQVPDRVTVYTMRTTVTVPESAKHRRLWFVVPQIRARTRLVVDGRRATAVISKPWDGPQSTGPQIFEIPAAATEDGELRLEWRITNFLQFSRWNEHAPELREVGSVGRMGEISQAASFFFAPMLFGGLLAIAFSAAASLFVDRRDWSAAALMVTTLFVLPLCIVHINVMQGVVPAVTALTISSVGLGLSGTACFYMLSRRWELGLRWWAPLPVIGFCIVVVFLLRKSPQDAVSALFAIGAVVECMAILPPTFALLRGRGRQDVGGRALLGYTLAFATVAGTPDGLMYAGLGENVIGGYGILISVLVASVAASFLLASDRTSELTRATDALGQRAVELADERSRLGVLRGELEGQMRRGKERLLEAIAAIAADVVSETTLAEGDLVDERYRVVRKLGIGGMGAVYEVERISDGSRFALKVSHEVDGESLARLAREALIGANVRSPSIVQVVDIGIAREGYLFMVMELFESRTLSESKSRYGDVEWALPILAKVARAIEVVHVAGIVHRDLKPSNILLSTHDRANVKLADFGISRFASDAEEDDAMRTGELDRGRITDRPPPGSTERVLRTLSDATMPTNLTFGTPTSPGTLIELTTAGLMAGTAAYMAPEAAWSSGIAPAADVFGFGVIAYQVLTGERPFETARDLLPGASGEVVLPPNLVDRLGGVDRRLLEVLDACRNVQPESRPTIADVVAAFENAV